MALQNNPIEYGFDDRLVMSQGASTSLSIERILLDNIPGSLKANQAHEKNDRNGVDYWVEHASGKHLGVDVKVREKDFFNINSKYDDLALETYSVKEKKILGWTLNESKRTDYILWYWKDSGRWMLVPFPMLLAVFKKNLNSWVSTYKVSMQKTPTISGGYHSECVFVPRKLLWEQIYLMYSGKPL